MLLVLFFYNVCICSQQFLVTVLGGEFSGISERLRFTFRQTQKTGSQGSSNHLSRLGIGRISQHKERSRRNRQTPDNTFNGYVHNPVQSNNLQLPWEGCQKVSPEVPEKGRMIDRIHSREWFNISDQHFPFFIRNILSFLPYRRGEVGPGIFHLSRCPMSCFAIY